jgi:hypothetical protein
MVGVGVPDADDVKVAVAPDMTAWLIGCSVMAGALPDAHWAYRVIEELKGYVAPFA